MKVKWLYHSFKLLTLLLGFLFLLGTSTSYALDENKVSAGDLNHLNRAFERLAKSDGYIAENWDIVIGKSITNNPTNFLKAYKKNEHLVTRLDALVNNLGPEYVDDFKRQAVQIRNRINALKSITDESLKPLAKECIEELQRHLKVIEKPINHKSSITSSQRHDSSSPLSGSSE